MNKRKYETIVEQKQHKKLKNKNGITLIALVITIIVMLILAGVSLNATIGENGIISKAKDATYAQSVAVLEDFLQEKYVEKYSEFEGDDSKVLKMMQMYPQYFYDPSKDTSVSINTPYVTVCLGDDYMPYAIYIIDKAGLPDEISKNLVGGNGGEKNFSDYISLNDVYCVTSDLEVFYSNKIVENNINGYGANINDIDKDNPARIIYEDTANGIGKILLSYDSNGDNKLSVSETKGIKSLTLDSSVTNVKDIYNLSSLETLYINDANLDSLSGIENCQKLYYIFINNSVINDYSAIGNLGNKLKYLYLVKTSNEEVVKLSRGIEGKDLPNLQYFGLVGYYRDYRFLEANYLQDDITIRNDKLTDISPLEKFSDVTKQAIKYLYLNNNSIKDVKALKGFTNVYALRLGTNLITNLSGLEDMTNLSYLGVSYNNLTDKTPKANDSTDAIYSLSNLNKLYSVRFNNNTNLIWVDYLKNNTDIKYLYLEQCSNLNHEDVSNIASLIRNCIAYTLNNNYSLDIMDENETTSIKLEGQTISDSMFKTLKKYKNVTKVNLKGLKIVDSSNTALSEAKLNELLKEVIPNFTKVEALSLNGIKFSDLSCISSLDKLRELDLRNTNVTTLKLDASNKVLSGINADKMASIKYEYDSQNRVIKASVSNDTIYTITYTIDSTTGNVTKTIKYNDNFKYYNCLNIVNTKNLGLLGINNSNDDLTNIQKTISNLYLNPAYSANGSFWAEGTTSGLICQDSTALKTMENCTEITNLLIYGHGDNCSTSTTLDLSKCNKLLNVRVCSFGPPKIILPASVIYVDSYFGVGEFDFVSGSNLKSITLRNYSYTGNVINNMVGKCNNIKDLAIRGDALSNFSTFSKINELGSLEKLILEGNVWEDVSTLNYSVLEKLNELTNSNIKTISIDRLPIKDLNGLANLTGLNTVYVNNTYVSNITGISNLSNLTNVTITYSKVNDVSALGSLTNLISLKLNNNFISTGFNSLSALVNLTELNLASNSISNYDAYKNADNKDETYNVLKIFANLNKNGKLKTLNIKNNYFTSYNELNETSLEITK